jgi:methionyl-tRNA formyltransferase
VAEIGADLGVVVAYGRIIPSALLERLPMVNLHFSLLPRWRGAAPVERAVLAGDDRTGVCLMRLEAGLDTGPVIDCRSVEVGDAHVGELLERLSLLGAELLVEHLRHGVAGLGPGTPQSGEPTYAAKIDPSELCLDWTLPAEMLVRVVRLDRAWTTFRGSRLRVLDAVVAPGQPGGAPPGTVSGTVVACGRGAVQLETVQPEGKRAMDARQWANGARPEPGELLGDGGPAR